MIRLLDLCFAGWRYCITVLSRGALFFNIYILYLTFAYFGARILHGAGVEVQSAKVGSVATSCTRGEQSMSGIRSILL